MELGDLKYHGKTWAEVGKGDLINRAPFGTSIVGNMTNSFISNLMRSGFNSDRIKFMSASKNIMRRYLMGLASRQIYNLIGKESARDKELKARFDVIDKAIAEKKTLLGDSNRLIIKDGKMVSDSSMQELRNKYSNEIIKGVLEIAVPDDIPTAIRDINPNAQSIGYFSDALATITTSTNKNIVLNTVQGRNTSRKEFISDGDIKITVNGQIHSEKDEYPTDKVANFIALMQYSGILNVNHFVLNLYNVTGILIPDSPLPAN